MKTITASGLNGKTYDILIDKGGLGTFIDIICDEFGSGSIFLISDDNVFSIYGRRLKEYFGRRNVSPFIYTFPAGEKSKTIYTAIDIIRFLSSKNAGRDSLIVSFGGGVTGDLCGFVSSVYKRGIEYVSIPTTVISVADSSVGMKNGVDFEGIKNVAGTFYQPLAVFVDSELCKTLPETVLCDGFGEILKYAWLKGGNMFRLVYNLKGPSDFTDNLDRIFAESIEYKDFIVSRDTLDKGIRHVLNAGHTIGHALEGASEGKISHGYAVSAGLVFSVYMGIGREDKSFISGTVDLLERFGIKPFYRYEPSELYPYVMNDKKMAGGKIDFITFSEPGYPVNTEIYPDELLSEYNQYLKFIGSEFYGRL